MRHVSSGGEIPHWEPFALDTEEKWAAAVATHDPFFRPGASLRSQRSYLKKMRGVELQYVGDGVTAERERQLQAAIRPLKTLEQVIRWGLSLSPPRLVSTVITQDEYSLDVCLPIDDGLVLAFEST